VDMASRRLWLFESQGSTKGAKPTAPAETAPTPEPAKAEPAPVK
jgi:hypothetical protein